MRGWSSDQKLYSSFSGQLGNEVVELNISMSRCTSNFNKSHGQLPFFGGKLAPISGLNQFHVLWAQLFIENVRRVKNCLTFILAF
jgi:hypothetical protein